MELTPKEHPCCIIKILLECRVFTAFIISSYAIVNGCATLKIWMAFGSHPRIYVWDTEEHLFSGREKINLGLHC